jgi:uncharacterized protein YcfL
MKRLILLLLAVSLMLLVACTAPETTQTVTVTSTVIPKSTQKIMVTQTVTLTFTVTATRTVTATSPVTTTTSATTTTPATTPGQATYNITGKWSGNWWRSDGKEEGTLTATLTQSGSSLSGDMTFTSTTFQYSQDTTILGSVDGNDVVFGMAIGGNGGVVTIDFEGSIFEDSNRMSGTYSMSTGYTGTWDVTRSLSE